MTVRVANDFKTETQVAYENLVMDNKTQRDKIRALEQEIVKLNKGNIEINPNIYLTCMHLFKLTYHSCLYVYM